MSALRTLVNAQGATATIAPLGATLVELQIPDRDGRLGNVVLGLDDIADYARQGFFLGAVCGRVCNRIRDARFTLGDVTYHLEANDPPHHLHGGSAGWHRVTWVAEPLDPLNPSSLALTHRSPAGDAGYPGEVTARVVYTLTDDNALRIEMVARTDRPTPVNLTQHSYFNLAGGGTVLDHLLTVFADAYTPGDPVVPTGTVEPVAGTPFDYRNARRVAPELDHNFVVGSDTPGPTRTVARLFDPRSGRTMSVQTDQPGLQVYAGKFLDGSTAGRGVTHVENAAVCLETQAFPNAINIPAWRSQVLLHPGDTYRHTVVYAFSTDRMI